MRMLIHCALVVLLGFSLLPAAGVDIPGQAKFATPNDAATALAQALKTNDLDRLKTIFGADAVQAVSSGDPVADRNDREVVALAMEQSWRWAPHGVNRKELVIGAEAWPFPVPLVKRATGWQFDVVAGQREVLARRIGRNELTVIGICRAYVAAQKEYASQGHDGKPAGIFAQKVRSAEGHQDGLYWPAGTGVAPSPLGDLAAEAAADGYDRQKNPTAPFHGYYFRILTAQGNFAPGGAKDYITNGNMSGGFALLAYPAKYGASGVMTFIVNQSGVVYQKNLGKDTAQLAAAITTYNPSKTWTRVRNPVPVKTAAK